MTPADRAALALRVREERAPHLLEFVENAAGSIVHVVANVPAELAPPPSTDPGDVFVALMLGEVRAVCSVVVFRNRGGLEVGGRLTGHFDDNKLCRRCHAAFTAAGGEHAAALIFADNRDDAEVPQ